MYMYMHTTCTVHAADLQQYRGIWTGHARTRLALHNIQCVALFNGTDFLTAVELIMTVCALKGDVDIKSLNKVSLYWCICVMEYRHNN